MDGLEFVNGMTDVGSIGGGSRGGRIQAWSMGGGLVGGSSRVCSVMNWTIGAAVGVEEIRSRPTRQSQSFPRSAQ